MPWPAPPLSSRDGVRLAPLGPERVDVDTAAYRASPNAIRAHSRGRWPASEAFTAAENLPLLRQHEAEHEAGEAFAYAILDVASGRELGCAYLRPLRPVLERSGTSLAVDGDDLAVLTYWLVDDASARPDATTLLRLLVSWVEEWGFRGCALRYLPEEAESAQAADALGLAPIQAGDQELPYRWRQIKRWS